MPTKRSSYSSENSFYGSSDEEYLDLGETSNAHGSSEFDDQPEHHDQRPQRGRQPSKRPCLNKNALMARENRKKKKEYIEGLENQLETFRSHEKNQTEFIQQQNAYLKRLASENAYLRSVLKNKTGITSLLSSMNKILLKDKLQNDTHHDSNANKMDASSRSRPNKTDNSYASKNQGDNCNVQNPAYCESVADMEPVDDLNELGLLHIDDNYYLDNFNDYIPKLNADGDNTVKQENGVEDIGDAGVCFHIGNGKDSMEFCIICHLDSINSDGPVV